MSQNTKLQLLKLMTKKRYQLHTEEDEYIAKENMDSLTTMLQRSQKFLLRIQGSAGFIAVASQKRTISTKKDIKQDGDKKIHA